MKAHHFRAVGVIVFIVSAWIQSAIADEGRDAFTLKEKGSLPDTEALPPGGVTEKDSHTVPAHSMAEDILGSIGNPGIRHTVSKAAPPVPLEPSVPMLSEPRVRSVQSEQMSIDSTILRHYMSDDKEEAFSVLDEMETQLEDAGEEEELIDSELELEMNDDEQDNENRLTALPLQKKTDIESLYNSILNNEEPDSTWPLDSTLLDRSSAIKGHLEAKVSWTRSPKTDIEIQPDISESGSLREQSKKGNHLPAICYDTIGHPLSQHDTEIKNTMESVITMETTQDSENELQRHPEHVLVSFNYTISEPADSGNFHGSVPEGIPYPPAYDACLGLGCSGLLLFLLMFLHRSSKQNQGQRSDSWRYQHSKEEKILPIHVKAPINLSNARVLTMEGGRHKSFSIGYPHTKPRPSSGHVRHMSLGSSIPTLHDPKLALCPTWKTVERDDKYN
ncbi:hypothetical protein BDF14DRAFT_1882019 [Spinellus fusiger]|nr:hypothetical protein BDF14DRAFT_1882019 [Spinellus fusiger]